MTWLEIKARFASLPADTSPLVEIFRAHGSENTIEDGPSITGCLVDVPGVDEIITGLRRDLEAAGAVAVEVNPVEEQNWDEIWRRYFKARRVGQRIVVRPTWEEFDAEATDLIITLDPGQAFGTGDHPTTRMCLELVEAEGVAGRTVLDLGCGSGILAIAADKLGAARTLGVDIEPVSVEVAKENGRMNGSRAEFVLGDAAEPVPGPWDVVVSNIISATLIRLAPDAYDLVAEGGTWIVSGIIEQNWPDVRAAAEREGFATDRMVQEIDWVAARFIKR